MNAAWPAWPELLALPALSTTGEAYGHDRRPRAGKGGGARAEASRGPSREQHGGRGAATPARSVGWAATGIARGCAHACAGVRMGVAALRAVGGFLLDTEALLA